jgi:DNA-binding transcriptional MerR regulator
MTTKWQVDPRINETKRIFSPTSIGLISTMDASQASGLSQSTIIAWSDRGLIIPVLVSQSKGKRLFSPSVIQTLEKLKEFRDSGGNIARVKNIL